MPKNITLKIGSEQYDILRCFYDFHRSADSKRRPVGGMCSGDIILTMESNSATNLFERFIGIDPKNPYHPTAPFSGSVEICDEEEGTPVRTLAWDVGYFYAISENMQGDSPLPMTQTFSISPLRLDINRTIRLDRRFPQTYGA